MLKMQFNDEYTAGNKQFPSYEITDLEQNVMSIVLFRHRFQDGELRRFNELRFLDQVEVLFWAVDFGFDNDLDITNIRMLLRSIIEDRFDLAYKKSLTKFKLEKAIDDIESQSIELLKEAWPQELL